MNKFIYCLKRKWNCNDDNLLFPKGNPTLWFNRFFLIFMTIIMGITLFVILATDNLTTGNIIGACCLFLISTFGFIGLVMNSHFVFREKIKILKDTSSSQQEKIYAAECLLNEKEIDRQCLELIIQSTPVNSEENNKALERLFALKEAV